jgi:hypothetical protein
VLVHPQSLVHSLVEFVDGSTLAQLGLPDMRTTLAVGLGWPERIESGVAGLDLLAQGRLDFEAPDPTPSLPAAGDGGDAAGGTAPAVLNAANEEAVSAFLQGRIGFLTIPRWWLTLFQHCRPSQPIHWRSCWPPMQAASTANTPLPPPAQPDPPPPNTAAGPAAWLIPRIGLVDDRQPRVLVTFHEFGHYWVGPPLGQVLRFSVGFGRPLWSRRDSTAPSSPSPPSRWAAT